MWELHVSVQNMYDLGHICKCCGYHKNAGALEFQFMTDYDSPEKQRVKGFDFSTQFSRIHSGYPLERSCSNVILPERKN